MEMCHSCLLESDDHGSGEPDCDGIGVVVFFFCCCFFVVVPVPVAVPVLLLLLLLASCSCCSSHCFYARFSCSLSDS